MLETIIPSKTRRKILGHFFTNIGTTAHLRKIARIVDEEINAVKRELDILEKGGVLKKEKRVNKMIYSLNHKYLFFSEFLHIFVKEGLLVTAILKNHSKIGKIKYAVLSEKYARRQSIKQGEVYLLFVGVIVIPEIVSIVAEEEKRFGMELNYTVMTEEEFNFRKKNSDPFIWSFLKQSKIMIVGEEDHLLS